MNCVSNAVLVGAQVSVGGSDAPLFDFRRTRRQRWPVSRRGLSRTAGSTTATAPWSAGEKISQQHRQLIDQLGCCSVFVGRAWMAAFGDFWPTFQGTEQTPKDNYMVPTRDPT